jgi:hypothetical protein
VINETAALNVLLGGMIVSNVTNSTNMTQTQTGSGSNTRSHSSIGAIVGGTVGGVVILLLAIGTLVLFLRERALLVSGIISTFNDPLDEPRQHRDTLNTSQSKRRTIGIEKTSSNRPTQATEIPSSPRTEPPSLNTPTTPVSNPIAAEDAQLIFSERQVGETLTTNELVGMLNERLRRGDVVWNHEELPPIYDPSEHGE